MKGIEKYELMFISFSWIFILVASVQVLINDYIGLEASTISNFRQGFNLLFLLSLTILNFIKLKIVKNSSYANRKTYFISRIFETLLINFSIVYLGLGDWAYALHFFLILVTCLNLGRKLTLILVGYAFILNIIIRVLIDNILKYNTFLMNDLLSRRFIEIIFIYAVLFLYALLCGKIYDSINANEVQNKRLFAELAKKYEQLTEAQQEIKIQNDKLMDTNIKGEDTNKKLRISLAELFTVQQIIQAISSIFELKELLQHVNDIIIGVMGVNNSSIMLYDEKKSKLKIFTTTITNRNELIPLNDNINSDILMNVINTGEPILENFVDQNEYSFAQDRDVNSLICVPLVNKSKKYGLVLIEQKYNNAFDDDNLRLLNTIGQQVGIALENVELYQKMHELATIDGLTGIFNRLYFQERLSKEIQMAQNEGYELSLAIFDIDFFKRFNDTFGHLFGDKVLKHIAELMKNSLRSKDLLARFGGEEFVILLPRTGIKEAYEKVEKLREIIARTSIKDELITASVTVSFGLSSYPEFASTESELLKTADNALYEAKECGRNCVRITK